MEKEHAYLPRRHELSITERSRRGIHFVECCSLTGQEGTSPDLCMDDKGTCSCQQLLSVEPGIDVGAKVETQAGDLKQPGATIALYASKMSEMHLHLMLTFFHFTSSIPGTEHDKSAHLGSGYLSPSRDTS